MGHPVNRVPHLPSAVVLVLLIAVVLLVLLILLVLLVLLVLVLLVLVLILFLIVHNKYLHFSCCGIAAELACPKTHVLSLALNKRLAKRPAVMAAAIPPAQAFSPPVKMPRNPSVSMASLTPFARL